MMDRADPERVPPARSVSPGLPAARPVAPPRWDLKEVVGRLVEVVSGPCSAAFSFATLLVREAQEQNEPAAWITVVQHGFYAPDLAASGVDLSRLWVIRVPRGPDVLVAADRLIRSGGLGLCILDLLDAGRVVPSVPARLAGLARRHGTAVICLTGSGAGASLGSMVSLRCQAVRGPIGPDGQVVCRLLALKDRQRGLAGTSAEPGWVHEEIMTVPDGLV